MENLTEKEIVSEGVVFAEPPPASFLELDIVATDLQCELQNILKEVAMVTVKFGFRVELETRAATPIFRVRVNKRQGEATEHWGIDFGRKCLHFPYELHAAITRILNSFEETEKAQGIQNNNKLKMENT